MNRLVQSMRVTESVGDHVPYLNTLSPDPFSFSLDHAQIQITGSTLISAYKWQYTAKPVARKKDGTYEDVQVSVGTAIVFPLAFNGYENGNSGSSVNAIAGEDPNDLPTAFDIVPIPSGVIVTARLLAYYDADGSIAPGDSYYWFFSLMNPMEGMCS